MTKLKKMRPMKNNPWANASNDSDVQIPQNIDKLIDTIIQFSKENDAYKAIHVMTVSLGMIVQTLDKKDLENVRTIFDQIKFNVIDTLSEAGWK